MLGGGVGTECMDGCDHPGCDMSAGDVASLAHWLLGSGFFERESGSSTAEAEGDECGKQLFVHGVGEGSILLANKLMREA